MHIEYLKIKDVGNILGFKDSRSTKKWIKDHNIPISTIGGKKVISQFAFEFKRQQLLVEELRKVYPNKWFEIYDNNTPDKGMVKAIRELYPETIQDKKVMNKVKRYIK